MQLKTSTLLQGGKYRIEKVLGQGGFGITYLAMQVGLDREVAIKEFFMKEHCERDATTSHVTTPTSNNRDLVARFRQKFIKEAQTIARLNHSHIIRIYDIFEENDTAYYVMEYHDKGSLSELVKQRGALPEAEALRYIREVADALAYIHEHQMNHLDVKPGNVLLDEKGRSVLIDFGLSKRYDESGQQTSTTPVGISHGYAPMEQYKQGGVGTFSPATDIYSLGATLYKLLTGQTPPDASDVFTDGLPALPISISSSISYAITQAMSPNKKNRPQSVAAFLALLDKELVVVKNEDDDEDTVFGIESKPTPTPKHKPEPEPQPTTKPTSQPALTSSKNKWLVLPLVGFVVALAIIFLVKGNNEEPIPLLEKYTYNVNGVSFTMRWVAGGTFQMGSSDSDAVTLSSYSIGETEVTQALWTAVMGNNPSRFTGYNLPVEQVSWDDCQVFISKLNSLTGENFRLPTEAEWEFAARGGNSSYGYKYAGSDNIDEVAWYDKNSGGETHNVMTKSPNELGLYDMTGNVYEWCSDWFENNPSLEKVLCGGSWSSIAQNCSVSVHYNSTPSTTFNNLGLRLALTQPNTIAIPF